MLTRRLPKIGFLAADIEDDPHDLRRALPISNQAARVHADRGQRRPAARRAGRRCLRDDLAGAVRPRRRIPADAKEVFWQEEPAYIEDIKSLGYGAAVLADLKVHHTGGDLLRCDFGGEVGVLGCYWKRQARRAAIKRLVFRIPFFRRLNARFNWFVAPS